MCPFCHILQSDSGSPGGASGKSPANAELVRDAGLIPGWEGPLEKRMATLSSILAWRIPWTEEPGRLQSIGSHRVGHDSSDLACTRADRFSS